MENHIDDRIIYIPHKSHGKTKIVEHLIRGSLEESTNDSRLRSKYSLSGDPGVY